MLKYDKVKTEGGNIMHHLALFWSVELLMTVELVTQFIVIVMTRTVI